jgi:hypothetical protein
MIPGRNVTGKILSQVQKCVYMQSEPVGHPGMPRGKRLFCSLQVPAVILGILLLAVFLLASGCTTTGKDPVTGTWEWSDGHGYTERYTFTADHGFYAQALGSEFNGTWEAGTAGHYVITYRNLNTTDRNETLTEQVQYDSTTDEIYFPGHYRVA